MQPFPVAIVPQWELVAMTEHVISMLLQSYTWCQGAGLNVVIGGGSISSNVQRTYVINYVAMHKLVLEDKVYNDNNWSVLADIAGGVEQYLIAQNVAKQKIEIGRLQSAIQQEVPAKITALRQEARKSYHACIDLVDTRLAEKRRNQRNYRENEKKLELIGDVVKLWDKLVLGSGDPAMSSNDDDDDDDDDDVSSLRFANALTVIDSWTPTSCVVQRQGSCTT